MYSYTKYGHYIKSGAIFSDIGIPNCGQELKSDMIALLCALDANYNIDNEMHI